MALSERQQQIYNFMTRFSQEKGRPPTIREIGKAVGISSTSVVNYNLNILERAGLIAREKQVSRGLRVMGSNGKGHLPDGLFVQIPLLGRIVAGKPVPIPDPGSSGFEGESVTLTRDLVPDADNLYALHVKGESMVDASIHDGDIVVMRHQQIAQNGDLVAVWLKDEHSTTLKRYYREPRKVRLQPANPTFEPIYKDPKDVEIQGKVVLVIRQLERAA
ncbi:MAG: transcriptional repressor LexA [Anaerolineae bacterium]